MTETSLPEWAKEFDETQQQNNQYEKLPSFKILDGETKSIKFLDEGKQISKPEPAIIFTVEEAGIRKNYWLKKKQFNILKEIRKNIPLLGKKMRITRVGSTKTDTRYSIKFE